MSSKPCTKKVFQQNLTVPDKFPCENILKKKKGKKAALFQVKAKSAKLILVLFANQFFGVEVFFK